MSHGIPLDDKDRIPWLNSIREAMLEWDSNGRDAVLACSALKRSYRERLQINSSVKIVYLKGSFELFRERLHSRKGHYAGNKFSPGQFADLEEPTDAITIDAALPAEQTSISADDYLAVKSRAIIPHSHFSHAVSEFELVLLDAIDAGDYDFSYPVLPLCITRFSARSSQSCDFCFQ